MGNTREIKRFIFSLYFSDGIRITLGVLLPSLILSQFGLLLTGIVISLGAFAASIADYPGPLIHKRNAMLACIVLVSFTALITGFINTTPVLMMVGLLVFCFTYSMLTVFGERASNIGTAALLVMILSIDQHLNVKENFFHAFYLIAGGLWYFILSMSVLQIRPFRMAQQTLGTCIQEVAIYLKVKAEFYDVDKDYDSAYQKLLSQQIIVNQEQDAVREILFKTRQIVKESTPTGRQLVLVFTDIVDLFEQATATHYEYNKIRETYKNTNSLNHFKNIIIKISDELENLSDCIISNENPKPLHNFKGSLEYLKLIIDNVESEYKVNNLVLKKILINIRNIINRIQKIYNYYSQDKMVSEQSRNIDVSQFISHQDYDFKIFKENLTYDSAIFKHSLRVALVCVVGYIISFSLPLGHHSYWILLTILVILKPGFSLTKKRNYHRLIGTLIGGIAGGLIVILVKDEIGRFAFLVVFMTGAYTFLRQNYIIGVLFMTPYIIILFSFLELGGLGVAQERIFDTLIGSVIAFTASYYIFPSWEYKLLKGLMRNSIIANYNYLIQAGRKISGKQLDITEYKLARKEVYICSANLTSAFQRMMSEPKSKQKNVPNLHKFVVLNHTLSSYIASLIANLQQKENQPINSTHIKTIRKSLYQLSEAVHKLETESDKDFKELDLSFSENSFQLIEESPDSILINEELDFVFKVCSDINKISEKTVL